MYEEIFPCDTDRRVQNLRTSGDTGDIEDGPGQSYKQ